MYKEVAMKQFFLKEIPELIEHWEDIQKSLYTKQIKNKTTLLTEGDIADCIYYIHQGALRLWHNHDGKDITLQFFFEGQLVSSFESFYLQKESQFSIESIEDTMITILKKDVLDDLCEKYPCLKDCITKVLCHQFIEYTNSFLSRIKDTPEQRYIELVNQHKDLLDRVSHHYIASYLGITPVSLSRIRKRYK